MFASFTRSWRLFCACWEVLKSQPTLAIFPIISGIASLVFIAIFAIPLLLTGFFADFGHAMSINDTMTTYDPYAVEAAQPFVFQIPHLVTLFLLGLTLNIVTNFCNAAFTVAVLIKLSGRECSVMDAFRAAAGRFPAIAGYSVIGATVGMILRAIQERGFIGQIVGMLIGIAWAVITFLAIPVLVVENVGPVEGIKRSSALIKKRWGEGLIALAGVGVGTFIVSMLVVIIGFALILVAVLSGVMALIIFTIGLTLLGLLATAVLGRTLQGIFTAALYAHATTGSLMPGLPPDLIANAFGPKRKAKKFGLF